MRNALDRSYMYRDRLLSTIRNINRNISFRAQVNILCYRKRKNYHFVCSTFSSSSIIRNINRDISLRVKSIFFVTEKDKNYHFVCSTFSFLFAFLSMLLLSATFVNLTYALKWKLKRYNWVNSFYFISYQLTWNKVSIYFGNRTMWYYIFVLKQKNKILKYNSRGLWWSWSLSVL